MSGKSGVKKFRLKGISNVDTTKGVIWKQLLLFALPIIFSNFLQQLYNTIDLLIVGNYAGKHSLGAVGSTGSITGLLVGLFAGVSVGASVAAAQAYGAEDDKRVYKTVHSALFVAFASGIVLTVLGVFLSGPLLRAMHTPPEQLGEAVRYMQVIFIGMVPMSVYNMTAAILRAVGDSKRPLIFLIISSVLNLILDLLFVALLDWGVAGAAWATVIAQLVSAVLGLVTLMRSDMSYRLFIKEIKPYRDEILLLLRIGLPAGMQSVVISFANTIIQSQINTYGPFAVEAYATANRIDGFYYMGINSFSLALTTFVGQNIGARRRDRARDGVKWGMLMASGLAALMGLIFFFSKDAFLNLFNVSAQSRGCGRMMLTIAAASYWIFAFGDVLTGAFRGAGMSAFPMIASLINMCVVRLIWIYSAQPFYPNPITVFLAFPISWVMQAAVMFIAYKIRFPLGHEDKKAAEAEEKEEEARRVPAVPETVKHMSISEQKAFYAKQREGVYIDPEHAQAYPEKAEAPAGKQEHAKAEEEERA